jgi:hypothetical protein
MLGTMGVGQSYFRTNTVDNPEFTDAASKVVFVCLCIYIACHFIHGLINENVKPFKFPEKFDIGYIDDPVPPQIVYKTVYVREKEKSKGPGRRDVPVDPPKTKQEIEIEQAMAWLEQFKTPENFLPVDQMGKI